MSRSYRPLAFTPSVIDAQVAYGSRAALERLDRTHPGPGGPGGPRADPVDGPEQLTSVRDPLTDEEREFIAGMDGFYLASISETGWPYVQFRGGPPGFVTTPDEHTMAWPDFRGNRQYISAGTSPMTVVQRSSSWITHARPGSRFTGTLVSPTSAAPHPAPPPRQWVPIGRRWNVKCALTCPPTTGTAPNTSRLASQPRSSHRCSDRYANASPTWKRRTRSFGTRSVSAPAETPNLAPRQS